MRWGLKLSNPWSSRAANRSGEVMVHGPPAPVRRLVRCAGESRDGASADRQRYMTGGRSGSVAGTAWKRAATDDGREVSVEVFVVSGRRVRWGFLAWAGHVMLLTPDREWSIANARKTAGPPALFPDADVVPFASTPHVHTHLHLSQHRQCTQYILRAASDIAATHLVGDCPRPSACSPARLLATALRNRQRLPGLPCPPIRQSSGLPCRRRRGSVSRRHESAHVVDEVVHADGGLAGRLCSLVAVVRRRSEIVRFRCRTVRVACVALLVFRAAITSIFPPFQSLPAFGVRTDLGHKGDLRDGHTHHINLQHRRRPSRGPIPRGGL